MVKFPSDRAIVLPYASLDATSLNRPSPAATSLPLIPEDDDEEEEDEEDEEDEEEPLLLLFARFAVQPLASSNSTRRVNGSNKMHRRCNIVV